MVAPARETDIAAANGANRLAKTAAALLPTNEVGQRPNATNLGNFVDLLRDWIVQHHDLPGSRSQRIERSHLLLCAMASADTLGQAIAVLERFRRVVWVDRGARIAVDGQSVAIVLDQAARTGTAGFLSEIWSLSFLLAELEFLVGGRIEGVEGYVRAEVEPNFALTALLFNRPLTSAFADLTLRFPVQALSRPIIVRSDQLTAFLHQLMPRTVNAQISSPEMAQLVAAILRADRLHGLASGATIEAVAAQLGYGIATLRRRLAAEKTNFRYIREQVYDELATQWLRDGDRVESIANRLGYSDTFAFRRAFWRRNGCSPSAYRRAATSS